MVSIGYLLTQVHCLSPKRESRENPRSPKGRGFFVSTHTGNIQVDNCYPPVYSLQVKSPRDVLGREIKNCLEELRHAQGWSLDDLAKYLKMNALTVRNSLSRENFSDLVVSLLLWAKAIPEELGEEYKAALEREKIEKRREEVE